MEAAGALKAGDQVTPAVLDQYGCDTFALRKTDLREHDAKADAELDVWMMSFSPTDDQ